MTKTVDDLLDLGFWLDPDHLSDLNPRQLDSFVDLGVKIVGMGAIESVRRERGVEDGLPEWYKVQQPDDMEDELLLLEKLLIKINSKALCSLEDRDRAASDCVFMLRDLLDPTIHEAEARRRVLALLSDLSARVSVPKLEKKTG